MLQLKWCPKLHLPLRWTFCPSVLNFRAMPSWVFGCFLSQRRHLRLHWCCSPRWSYGDLSRPWYSPGLCHQCEEQHTGHPPLSGPSIHHLPYILSLPTFCFLLTPLTQVWPCPALTRFQCIFTGLVEGTSLVHRDLPWLHQLAAPEHGVWWVSCHSWSPKMATIMFSTSFLLVLHLCFSGHFWNISS